MGAGKGAKKRVNSVGIKEEVNMEILMSAEEQYCSIGRQLRDDKFSYATPSYDDIADLQNEKLVGRLTVVQQAEVIAEHATYAKIERDYKAHLATCEQCQAASAIQESIVNIDKV